MKFNNADKAQRVDASIFKVFVAVIEYHEQQEILTYASIYKSTALYNLSNVEHQKLSSNNGPYCKGHSMVTRRF